jgi:hypothetical protein
MNRLHSTLTQTLRRLAIPLAVLAASLSATAGQQAFFFQLNASQEVPPTASTATGVGLMTLDTTTGALSYNITFSGLSSAETAAHIHGPAPVGVNAGVIFTLPAGNPKVGNLILTAPQITNMLAGLDYVNIHTTTNPGGEIRGQVTPVATPIYLTVALSGAQEVPPTPSAGTGSGCFAFDPFAHSLNYNISFSGLTSAETAAHIHGFAGPGVNAGVLFALPAGSPKIGVVTLIPSQEIGMMNELTYANIHTTNFGGGEIRGQVLRGVAPAPVAFCPGDGTGTACPCGNNSAVGANAGCVNSFGVGGLLRSHGLASLGCESLVLDGTDLSTASSALFFQGTSQIAGGTAFGDGLRCAGGSVIRLATLNTSGGAASYPTGAAIPISIKGLVGSAGTRTYQIWYRNAAAFCTASTFNLSNGLQISWVP